jgi:hypothetical protein
MVAVPLDGVEPLAGAAVAAHVDELPCHPTPHRPMSETVE